MKICFSRHNGIGDICMMYPFVEYLRLNGHDIYFETMYDNFEIFKFLKSEINLIKYSRNPYTDNRLIDNNFDVFLNFNNFPENINDFYFWDKKDHYMKNLNQQDLYALIIKYNRLPIPIDFSVNAIDSKNKKNDKIYLFTNSTSDSRSIDDDVITVIKNIIPDIIINPIFNSKYELCDAIYNCKFLIGVDSGPLHLAELLNTNHIGLITNMSIYSRYKYYKYGTYFQSIETCSPCNHHGAHCDNRLKYNCCKNFDIEKLTNKINERIYKNI